MTPSALIATLTSDTALDLRAAFARAVLDLARAGAAHDPLTVLSVGGLAVPVRLTASVPALPDQVHTVEAYTFREFPSGAMLVVDGAVGIGLVAGDDAVFVNVTQPA